MEAIMSFPAPRSIKQLRSFLGFVNFDRFCANFSELTIPLLRLLKTGSTWKWGNKEEAFAAMKKAFIKVTMLWHPRVGERYYIQTYASNYGLGGCLYQINPESGDKDVIAYTSRTLSPAETRYSVTEKELLAVVHSVSQWRVFVLGQPLTIVTDHKALAFFKSCRLLNGRLLRWMLYLQEYSFDIEYCKCSENLVVDAMSRAPQDMKVCISESTEVRILKIDRFVKKGSQTLKISRKIRWRTVTALQ